MYSRSGRAKLRIFAILATLLQCGVLLWDGYATYIQRYKKGSSEVFDYAFPITCTGTVTLVAGMLVCSWMIDRSTVDTTYKITDAESVLHMLWLQRTCTVNDQIFQPYAIFANGTRSVIAMSHRKEIGDQNAVDDKSGSEKPWSEFGDEVWTTVGVFISLVGFIVQFLGLRSMHWSASLTQFSATLIMAGVRAWVRRAPSTAPYAVELLSDHELDWLATRASDKKSLEMLWSSPETVRPRRSDRFISLFRSKPETTSPESPTTDRIFWTQWSRGWGIQSGGTLENYRALRGRGSRGGAQETLETRIRLGELTAWPGRAVREAISVATAIELVMDTLYPSNGDKDEITWCMHTLDGEAIHFRIDRVNGKWRSNLAEVDSALSLWLYSVYHREQHDTTDMGDTSAWLRTGVAAKKKALRLLGPTPTAFYERTPVASDNDMKWWLGSRMDYVYQVGYLGCKEYPEEDFSMSRDQVTVETHRVVGPAEWGQMKMSDLSSNWGYESWLILKDPEDHKLVLGGPKAFAVISDAPLPQVYAQDMFSAFLWTVAPELSPIIASKTSGNEDNFWNPFTLESTKLSKLAEDIQETGLGSLDDVYRTLIPPLSSYSKLDNGIIEDLAIKQARVYESKSQWEKALKCLFWALPISLQFSFQKTPGAKTIGAILELQSRLASIIKFQQLLPLQGAASSFTKAIPNEALIPIYNDITTKLTTYAEEAILSKFAALYDFQGRAPPENPLVKSWVPLYHHERHEKPSTWSLGVTELHERVANRQSDYHPPGDLDHQPVDSLGWTVVHYAVLAEKWTTIHEMLKLPNFKKRFLKDLGGWTPLHYCFSANRDESHDGALTTIIDGMNGAVLQAKTHAGLTILHCAVTQIRSTLFKKLVKRYVATGIGVDIQDNRGMTALHLAVVNGQTRNAQVLLSLGHASPDLRQENRLTALHCAIFYYDQTCSKTIAKQLLSYGASKDATDAHGRTPLHTAVSNRNRALVNVLLEAGASLNKRDLNMHSPFQIAVQRGLNDEILRLLLRWQFQGQNDNESPPKGDLTLHRAIRCNNWEIVQMLVQLGVDPHEPSRNGTTLHDLVWKYDFQPKLLGEKFDINATDPWGESFLHHAVRSNRIKNVENLVSAGIDLGYCHLLGKTAIEVTDARGWTALHMASARGNKELVMAFLKAGTSCKNKDLDGETPANKAAKRGKDDEILRWLLQRQFQEQNNESPPPDDLPLHLSVRCNDWITVRRLIKLSVDPHETSKNGTTLHDLVSKYDFEPWILGRKFNAGVVDSGGNTLLHSAVASRRVFNVESMIQMGVDRKLRNKAGETALDLAERGGVEEIIVSIKRLQGPALR